jgi:hypothetical protein
MRLNRFVQGHLFLLAALPALANCGPEAADRTTVGDEAARVDDAGDELDSDQSSVAAAGGVVAAGRPRVPTCVGTNVHVRGLGDVRTVVAGRPSCSQGATPLFRYVTIAPDNSEVVLHDWTARSKMPWDVSGLDGLYRVRLEVRAAENPSQQPDVRVTRVSLGRPCEAPTAVSFQPTYPKDEPVGLRGRAACPSPQFRFQVRPVEGRAWRDACGGWTDEHGCDWMPPEAWGTGRYEMRVRVRRGGSEGIDFEDQSEPRLFSLVEGSRDAE